MTTAYRAGKAFEDAVRVALRREGYTVIRSGASKTKVDLVAIKWRSVLLVQCKRDGKIGPAERAVLLKLADAVGPVAVPLVAYRSRPRGPLAYDRLTSPHPKAREPWTPDEVSP